MNNFPKIINNDGGFKQEILLNNGKKAVLLEILEDRYGLKGHYSMPCPFCDYPNHELEIYLYAPDSNGHPCDVKRQQCQGGAFTGYNNLACFKCGIKFVPRLG